MRISDWSSDVCSSDLVVGKGKGSAVLPIEILVVDNGPGVPEHILDHLFNPFITGRRDGTGLGLALVDKLVRDMSGFVQYSRDHEAGESTFRILLPMGTGWWRQRARSCWRSEGHTSDLTSLLRTHYAIF